MIENAFTRSEDVVVQSLLAAFESVFSNTKQVKMTEVALEHLETELILLSWDTHWTYPGKRKDFIERPPREVLIMILKQSLAIFSADPDAVWNPLWRRFETPHLKEDDE
jgi:hypothetical protein